MSKGRGGYGDDVGRFDAAGSTSVQRRSAVKDLCDVGELMKVDSTEAEFRRNGWNKYETPTNNQGQDALNGLKGVQMPGGNAGMNGHYDSADYPGGTVA
jgi:hypothetical protein